MDYSNRNRTPADLERIEVLLRTERADATPLELDRIKLQAIHQAERARPSLYARKKGTFMKSRLALTLVLVAGFMLSTTGATLAITGSSGSGSAAESQYVQATNEGGNVKSLGGNGPAAEPVAANQEQVVSSGSGSLPFTGFVAIPLLIIGVGLIGAGAVLRYKSRSGAVLKH